MSQIWNDPDRKDDSDNDLEGVLKMNKIDAVPGTRRADPQCISDTRGREHRSDAAMRDFSLFQDTLLEDIALN